MRRAIVIALIACGLSYLALRLAWSEVWEKDQQAYMIFPVGLEGLYYLFRPLAYVDGTLTGHRFHIGPHR